MSESRRAVHLLALAAILLAGALFRGSYLREIARAPDFASPLADPAFHDYWARGLTGGDWTPPAGEQDPRIRETPFQRPPGYPYFLAGAYALTGGSFLGARVVQMAWGLLNVLLAYLLGRALASRAVGLVLAAFAATYWAFPYFEGELHAPVLVTTFNLAVLLALAGWARRPSGGRAFTAGLCLGAGAVVQTNALLFAPVAAGWMALGGRRLVSTAAASRSALALLAGTVVAVAPVTVRNVLVAKELVLIGSNGPITLYVGNNEEADGVAARIPYLQNLPELSGWSWFSYDRLVHEVARREGVPATYSAVSRFFTTQAVRFMREHPRKFLALTAKRAALFWGPDEIANNKSVRSDKAASGTLRHLPGFPWVLSLSLVGAGAMVLRERRRRPGRTPHDPSAAATLDPAARFAWIGCGLFIVTYFVSFLPFLAAARFRAPLLPVVFLFGAWGLVELARTVRRGAWSRAGLALVVWAALFVACRHSFFPSSFDEAWWHTDRAAALLRTNRLDEAVTELESALRANPGYVDAQVTLASILDRQGKTDEAIARYRDVLAHRPHRHDLRLRLATLLVGARRLDEAIPELQAVVGANPMSPTAQFELGRALLATGKIDEGLDALRTSVEINPAEPLAHLYVGIALARREDHEGAIAAMTKALELDPSSADALRERSRSFRALGKMTEAERDLLEMAKLRPQAIESPLMVGDFYFAQKRWNDAATWYARAVGVDARSMMARVNLGSALANGGKYAEAVQALEAALQVDPNDPAAQERLRVLRAYLAQNPAPRPGPP